MRRNMKKRAEAATKRKTTFIEELARSRQGGNAGGARHSGAPMLRRYAT